MAASQMDEVLQHLRSAALLREGAGLTDGQLLENFLSKRDESALAILVLRHAPMVWGVCRRILRDEHDAEDAFQATFLVLVRKGASIASRELLANWLHGVAAQTARKARAMTARRRAREQPVLELPEPAVPARDGQGDLRDLLDQALRHLPEKYRVPILLCDLQGKTRQEAAQELGWPEGTVAGRLVRAREMLAKRLARQGLDLRGEMLAAGLAQESAACVPTPLLSTTIQAASLFALGTEGAISATAIVLAEGVLQSMVPTKLRIAVVVLFAVLILGAGLALAGLISRLQAENPPDRTEQKALDALQGNWRISKLDIEHEETRDEFEKLGKVTIKGKQVTVLWDLAGQGQGKEAITWFEFTILKLDPGKSPPTIDLRLDKALEIQGLKPKIGTTVPGIYSVEGDTLKLFFDEDGRPKAFPEKEKQGVVTLKRAAAQKGKEEKP
jgi:RNA polymerase sigma factor (sigma-70 family)